MSDPTNPPKKRHPRVQAPNEPSRQAVLELALKAQCNPVTARKALIEGVDKIHGDFLKERLRAAMGS